MANDEPTDIAQRNGERDSMLLKLEVRFPETGIMCEVRVRNLSAGGLMAEAAVLTRRGETVELNMRNLGWIGGKVAWVAEGRFGIAFDIAIDPRDVRRPIGGELPIPAYLKKLNETTTKPRRLRPVT